MQVSRAGQCELELYTLGGDRYTGSLSDLDRVLDYVLSFTSTVSGQDEVRSLEFNAMWNLVGLPRRFREFVFSHQRDTDRIMDIYTQLRDVETTIADITLLKEQELDWLSGISW